MSHRRAAGRSALLALSLLLQTVLVALPTPSASAARATASSPVIEKTRKDLPTTAERLGAKDVATSDAEYVALAPEDESGELQADGSFRLPRNYAANPDAPTAAANGTAYVEQRQEKSKRKDGGGVGTLRLDVSGDITANTPRGRSRTRPTW